MAVWCSMATSITDGRWLRWMSAAPVLGSKWRGRCRRGRCPQRTPVELPGGAAGRWLPGAARLGAGHGIPEWLLPGTHVGRLARKSGGTFARPHATAGRRTNCSSVENSEAARERRFCWMNRIWVKRQRKVAPARTSEVLRALRTCQEIGVGRSPSDFSSWKPGFGLRRGRPILLARSIRLTNRFGRPAASAEFAAGYE